jgi:hemolysin III
MHRSVFSTSVDSFADGLGKLSKLEHELDERLFPDHPLYCEGMHKPKLRGVLHMMFALMLPLGLLHLFMEANGSLNGQVAAMIFILSNVYCLGVSALYHVGNWSAATEIFIQKLDHCGIAIYSAGINFPVALLLLAKDQGFVLVLLSTMTCSWACWHILNSRPAVWRFVVVASVIVLFFPILFWKMTTFEFTCAVMNAVLQAAGMTVFTHRKPDPWPSVCGYHELFHLICVSGMVAVYLANWSVIRRTCNPYAHQTDVVEVLLPFLLRREQ